MISEVFQTANINSYVHKHKLLTKKQSVDFGLDEKAQQKHQLCPRSWKVYTKYELHCLVLGALWTNVAQIMEEV